MYIISMLNMFAHDINKISLLMRYMYIARA